MFSFRNSDSDRRKEEYKSLDVDDDPTARLESLLDNGSPTFSMGDCSDNSVGLLPPPASPPRVSFGEIQQGKPAPLSDITHHEKTQEELFSQVKVLLLRLKEAEAELATERTMRKKKDKNMMKLAKELKKRNEKMEKTETRIAELEARAKDLDTKLQLARGELQQQQDLHDRNSMEYKTKYDKMVMEAEDKLKKTCAEHDKRITELSRRHAQQCDDLCKEILKVNLEADRLHAKLNAHKEGYKERSIELFSEPPRPKRKIRARKLIILLAIVAATLLGFLVAPPIFDVLCSPVMPGTVLNMNNSGTLFEAPWWTPEGYKHQVFDGVCGNRQLAELEWTPDNQDFMLVVKLDGKQTFSKRATSAEINTKRIRFWNRKDQFEDHQPVWARK